MWLYFVRFMYFHICILGFRYLFTEVGLGHTWWCSGAALDSLLRLGITPKCLGSHSQCRDETKVGHRLGKPMSILSLLS